MVDVNTNLPRYAEHDARHHVIRRSSAAATCCFMPSAEEPRYAYLSITPRYAPVFTYAIHALIFFLMPCHIMTWLLFEYMPCRRLMPCCRRLPADVARHYRYEALLTERCYAAIFRCHILFELRACRCRVTTVLCSYTLLLPPPLICHVCCRRRLHTLLIFRRCHY